MDVFLEYLDDSMVEIKMQENKLNADNRKDEANLLKIKSNIYGMAKAIYGNVLKHVPPNQRQETYIKRLNTEFVDKWNESYKKAEVYNDCTKMLVEEVKLQTLKMIIKKFEEIL